MKVASVALSPACMGQIFPGAVFDLGRPRRVRLRTGTTDKIMIAARETAYVRVGVRLEVFSGPFPFDGSTRNPASRRMSIPTIM